jgi:hypothetical protein
VMSGFVLSFAVILAAMAK